MGVQSLSPRLQNLNTSSFDEISTIYVDVHEKCNGSDPNFLGGHVGGLWGAAPSIIEIHQILVKFRSNLKFQGMFTGPRVLVD